MSKPTQAARMIERCIALQIPFYVAGPVGAGKSQVAKQAADKLGLAFTDVRLSQMDPTDIKGFPSPDAKNNQMRWLPADFLPKKGKGLLFFDELVSAPPAVQAACYQLFLDRRVGSYELPEGWSIGGAGNRAIDRSLVNRMPAALANRLVHIDYEVDVNDWVAHAMANNVSPDTIAFIRFRSKLLHDFNPDQNPMAFPTPRSWFTVDRILKDKMPSEDEHALIAGTIGQGAATELRAFLKVSRDLPTIDEISVAPDTTKVPAEPATLYALITTLSMATKTPAAFSKFMEYVQRMETEWQVVYVRDCLRQDAKVANVPAFTDWSIKNADVVL